MPTLNEFQDIDFGGPAVYRIVVQGALGENWSDRLGGMTITITERGELRPHSTLVGNIRDQAELNGVIETLYGLHLPILKVETIEDET